MTSLPRDAPIVVGVDSTRTSAACSGRQPSVRYRWRCLRQRTRRRRTRHHL